MRKLSVVVLLAGLFVFSNLLWSPAAVAPKKGKTRAASVEHLMKGIMFPNCAGLAKSLKDKGPQTDKDWETAEAQAACLNEMSYILMEDGRCPSGVWAKAAKTTLREGSAAVLAALKKRDLEGARTAFKQTTQACKACHSKHRHK